MQQMLICLVSVSTVSVYHLWSSLVPIFFSCALKNTGKVRVRGYNNIIRSPVEEAGLPSIVLHCNVVVEAQ